MTSDTPLLPEHDRGDAYTGFASVSVAAILAESAERHADRVAVVVGDVSTTYRELWDEVAIFVDPRDNEAYLADGYGNKRVAVVDADTGALKRYWGAYGNKPDDTDLGPYKPNAPPAPQFRNPVHCADLSVDRLVYVCDRVNNRIQVFRQNGEYLMERFVRPETGGSGSGFSLQFSRDAEQSLLYLIDGTNQRVWILRRKDLAIVDRFGKPGRQAGEFIRAHMIAIDSKNRMYTGEAGNGRRMQRWILKGTRPASSAPGA